MTVDKEILQQTSSRLFAASSPDYISLDKIETWLKEMDKKFPNDIQLRGISFDRTSNRSFGFKGDGSDYTVFAPSALVTSQKNSESNIQPPRLEIKNAKSNMLAPSQRAFIEVVKKGMELTPASNKTVLIDIATLPPSQSHFCDQCVDGSVMKGLAEAIESESMKDKKVVIRLLVGDTGGGGWDSLKSMVFNTFIHSDSKASKISHGNLHLYVGLYTPDFAPKADNDVQEVKKFLSKVLESPIFKGAEFANLIKLSEIHKMVDDLMTEKTLNTVPSITWNHGKLLAVNGQTLMTGGMNYYGEYIASSNHDICDHAVKIHGDAAVSGQRWADYFWKYLVQPSPTDRNSKIAELNLTKDLHSNRWLNGLDVPDSHEFSKTVSEKQLETLTVARLGDWYGSMKKIRYPVGIIDCIRDIIFNLAWHKVNLTGYNSSMGKAFLILVAYFSDDNLTAAGYLQDLGINPTAWASRYARTQAISYANDSVILSQQLLVQCFAKDKENYKNFVYRANAKITGKAVDEATLKKSNGVDSLPWNVPWDGNVWPYELLIALARALGNMSKSTKPNSTADGKRFQKESKGLYIVLSTDSKDGSHSSDWADKTTFYELKRRLRIIMQNLPYLYGGIDADKIDNVLDTLLHFRRTSTSKDAKNHDLYNHSKIVVVDRKIMYVGSDNAYPGYNEEHGVWIDDQPTIDKWLDDFLVHFWQICQEPTEQDRTGK